MYGIVAASLFSLRSWVDFQCAEFQSLRSTCTKMRILLSFCFAFGAKGDSLLRDHLKPQRLGGNVRSSCAYKRHHVVKPVSSSKVCRVFRYQAVLWCSPRQCLHPSPGITILHIHFLPQGCRILQGYLSHSAVQVKIQTIKMFCVYHLEVHINMVLSLLFCSTKNLLWRKNYVLIFCCINIWELSYSTFRFYHRLE